MSYPYEMAVAFMAEKIMNALMLLNNLESISTVYSPVQDAVLKVKEISMKGIPKVKECADKIIPQLNKLRESLNKIDAEISSRENADIELGGRIDAVQTYIEQVRQGVLGKIADEETARVEGDKVNADAIAAEQVRAESAEKANADAIAAEQVRAESAEKANADLILVEKNAREASDLQLSARIDSTVESIEVEVSERKAADEALESSIDTVFAKNAALQASINAEIEERKAADDDLKAADEILKAFIDGMVAKVAALQASINEMKATNEELAAKVAELEVKVKSNDFEKSIFLMKEGDVLDITLDSDIELKNSEKMIIPNGATLNLNLNGHTLTSNINDIMFRVNGTLNIGGGNVVSVDYCASVNLGGTVNISDGNYDCDTTCFQSNGGVLNINGGHFDAYNEEYKGRYTVNYIDAMKEIGDIKIIGGEFVNYNPADSKSENPAMTFVPSGYKIVETIVDGKTIYSVVKE